MSIVNHTIPKQFIRPSLLQEPARKRVRCLTCERRCEIGSGELGWCQTRYHYKDRLVTLIYGAVSSLSANHIEKKPLYHFYPGTRALTSGAWSCNFACPWCQNYHIAKVPPGEGRFMSPEEFVAAAIEWECRGTSISFNEPTLSLEWSLEVFTLTHEHGLYNTYVTNGYMTSRALGLLVDAGLDAMNVDIKGDAQVVRRYCGGIDVEKIWRNCRLARKFGVHLEITTLVIPGVNDEEEILRGIADRIVGELGSNVPWHVVSYYPAYGFFAPPTPLSALECAWHIGKEEGLIFVYLGNVSGHRLENTICPDCGKILIERQELQMTASHLDQGCCPGCGREIPGVWE